MQNRSGVCPERDSVLIPVCARCRFCGKFVASAVSSGHRQKNRCQAASAGSGAKQRFFSSERGVRASFGAGCAV